MKDSRLYTFFLELDKKERAEVTKAVNSAYFNVRADVAALWKLLCESDAAPTKEAAFNVIYPSQPLDVQKVRAVMSWLLSVIERALTFRQFEREMIPQKLYLLELYRHKALPQHFEETNRDISDSHHKIGRQDTAFYQQNYFKEWQNYEFYSSNRTAELNLQELSRTLDIGFLIEKLRQSCFLLAHQNIVQKEYETGLLAMVLQYIENQPNLLEIPALRIFYFGYFTLAQPADNQYFEKFMAALLSNFKILNEKDIRDLYLLAINYCIKKHNAGDAAFARQGLELYKKGLSEGFLLEDGILSRFSYRNIVAWALLFEEYEWAEGFIHEYKNRLERSYRDSMFSFSLARLEYSRKNYDAALLLLQKAEYRDILLGLAAKTILLKIYFERDEFDALDAHLASMRTYIKRKRVLGYHKTNYLNLINYTQKIVLAFGNKLKMKELQDAIAVEAILTEREWLLEQIA